MDGLDEDHDVLFVLTTNRADLLEPALATRPGRIDQAVELPLPDADGRRRLLELYGEGLELTPHRRRAADRRARGRQPRLHPRAAAARGADGRRGVGGRALRPRGGPGARAGGAPARCRRPHERVARRAAWTSSTTTNSTTRSEADMEVFRRLLPGPARGALHRRRPRRRRARRAAGRPAVPAAQHDRHRRRPGDDRGAHRAARQPRRLRALPRAARARRRGDGGRRDGAGRGLRADGAARRRGLALGRAAGRPRPAHATRATAW